VWAAWTLLYGVLFATCALSTVFASVDVHDDVGCADCTSANSERSKDKEKCMITILDNCAVSQHLVGMINDVEVAYITMGVGRSEKRCLARAQDWFNYCSNSAHEQIIATYTPTGASRAYPADDDVEQVVRRRAEALYLAGSQCAIEALESTQGLLHQQSWSPRNGVTFVDGEIPDIIVLLQTAGCLRNVAEYMVDIGIEDGHGPSEPLFFPQFSFAGLVVEGDSTWQGSINTFLPADNITKKFVEWVSPRCISLILLKHRVPRDFTYLKIDLDADDCAMLVAILQSGFRSLILQTEVTPEIPPPLAYGVLPLTRYGYKQHTGFQSCSSSMMTAIAQRYDYKLIAVGGTKDTLFAHKSVLPMFKVIDVTAAYYDFAACCWDPPNPSNTRWLQIYHNVKVGSVFPTEWVRASRRVYMEHGWSLLGDLNEARNMSSLLRRPLEGDLQDSVRSG